MEGDGKLVSRTKNEAVWAASTCQICGGGCETQSITLTLRRSKFAFAVIHNVPADVCQQCGESQFSVPTAGRLLAALHSDRAPDDMALLPIYDLSSL